MNDRLHTYRRKRDFSATPEPNGSAARAEAGTHSFVVQRHDARRLHYDFRLELDGTLKSWAVPKGPSLDPSVKRMAVQVEDHPLSYADFQGTIPPGHYGAGDVQIWDRGWWEPIGDARAGLQQGHLKFELHGEKLHGRWVLVRMAPRDGERQPAWLLIKEHDDEARDSAAFDVTRERPEPVGPAGGKAKGRATQGRAAQGRAAQGRAAKGRVAQGAATASGTQAARKTRTAEQIEGDRTAARQGNARKRAAAPAAAEPDMPANARRAALPRTLSPQLATLVKEPPHGDDWHYEAKLDGYRILARVDGDDLRLYTRNGLDWTARLKHLLPDLRQLGLRSAWLDGEIIVTNDEGAPDFQLLQNAFDSHDTERIRYVVFDLPYCNGFDLRAAALIDRRALLRKLMQAVPAGGTLSFSDDFDATPAALLRSACRMGLEGVIGKRGDAPYVSRRSTSWIKLKCGQRQEFVIGGYTDPQGTRRGFGALLLGVHDEAGRLRYAGRVGSGFTTQTLDTLAPKLKALTTKQAPFAEPPREAHSHWVKPQLVAEIAFAEWTRDDRVRQAVFQGLRNDKPPRTIVRERPKARAEDEAPNGQGSDATNGTTGKQGRTGKAGRASGGDAAGADATGTPANGTAANGTAAAGIVAAGTAARRPPRRDATVGGVRITHPDRLIDPANGITKLDLVLYYESIAELLLAQLRDRPVALVRAPDGLNGERFFQKHPLASPALRESTGDPPMLAIGSVRAIIEAVQMNTIEFHTSNTRNGERPDRIVFDLDPGDGVAWPMMLEAAHLTRALLSELSLTAFLKTSGSRGLHVVVPIAANYDWDTVKAFSQAVVNHLAQTLPQRFVAKSGPRNRVGRIFADYLRNGRGATTAAAFSARARPGLPVSMPIDWKELETLPGSAHWSIADAHRHVEAARQAWAGYGRSRQGLARAFRTLGFEPPA